MNYKMILQYEGTRFDGWQKQKNTERTVQGKLEQVLSRLAGQEVEVQGAGRTDAGVHALGQTASFRLDTELKDGELKEYLNRYLPENIAVLELEQAPPRFHARLNAVRKTYVYTIWNSAVPNVFGRRFMTRIEEPLDVERMREAAGYLCGKHDFLAFSSLNPRRFKKSTVRRLDEVRIEQKEAVIRIYFTGDGFLYHMVRILAGTLVEAGLGLRCPEEMGALLESGNRADAGRLMPPEGLTLLKVEYS